MVKIKKIIQHISSFFGNFAEISSMEELSFPKYKGGIINDVAAYYCPYIPVQRKTPLLEQSYIGTTLNKSKIYEDPENKK